MNPTRDTRSERSDPVELPARNAGGGRSQRARILLRVAVIGILLAVIVGIVWYVVRDRPDTRMRQWRALAERFFATGNLTLARRFNERVLEIAPDSAPDLLVRARLLESEGGRASLIEALEVYDAILDQVGPRAAGVNYYKARVYHALGDLDRARGLASSVLDAYPFEATIELGRIAMARMEPRAALGLFRRALNEHARDDEDRAVAWDAIATSCSQLLSFASVRDADALPLDALSLAEIESLRLDALESERKIIAGFLAARRSVDDYGPWLAHVATRIAEVAPGNGTPCLDAARAIETTIGHPAGRAATRPETHLRLGALYLDAISRGELERAPADRRVAPDELRTRAFTAFKTALLETDRAAARELIDLASRARDDDSKSLVDFDRNGSDASPRDRAQARASEYVERLIDLSRALLDSPEHGRLLADDSSLEIDGRLSDAIDGLEEETAGVFSVVRGLAALRAGDEPEARRHLDRFIASADDKLVAALGVATHISEIAPEKDLLVEYLDRVETEARSPFDRWTERVSLLLDLARDTHRSDAARARLDALLRSFDEAASSSDELLLVVRATRELRGYDAAIEKLIEAVDRFPEDRELRALLAGARLEHGRALWIEGNREAEALGSFSLALGDLLHVFARAPLGSTEIMNRIRELVLLLAPRETQVGAIARAISIAFPDRTPEERTALSHALVAFAEGRWLELARQANALDGFGAFAAWLTGTAWLESAVAAVETERGEVVADLGGADADPDGGDHGDGGDGDRDGEDARKLSPEMLLERASAAYSRAPSDVACRVGLARVGLAQLSPDEDVPSDLFERIHALADDPTIEHHGRWLLSLALLRRVEWRAAKGVGQAKLLGDLLAEARLALRLTIERNPDHALAWLRLADTWVLAERFPALSEHPAFTTDHERALLALRSAPSPTPAITERISRYLERLGRLREARLYTAALVLVNPDGGILERFVRQSLDRTNPATAQAMEKLLDPETTVEAEPAVLEEVAKLEAVLAGEAENPLRAIIDELCAPDRTIRADREAAVHHLLRQRLESMPHQTAIRHEILATLFSGRASEKSAEAEAARRKVVGYLRASVAAWADMGHGAPVPVLNNLAWYLIESQDPAERNEGLAIAREMINRVPDPATLPAAHDTYAWALFQTGDLDGAQKVLATLVERFGDPTFHYHLARVLAARGDHHGALREVETALGRRPTDDAALWSLREELRRAIDAAESAAKKGSATPENPPRAETRIAPQVEPAPAGASEPRAAPPVSSSPEIAPSGGAADRAHDGSS